jgi:segregation and condensation protein B
VHWKKSARPGKTRASNLPRLPKAGAFRQPLRFSLIEDIRGVSVNAQIVKTLEDRGWIECIGHRDVPGRPALYATTGRFLSDLGLRSLQELPPLEDIGSVLEADHSSQLQAALNEVPPTGDEDEEETKVQESAGHLDEQETSSKEMNDPDNDVQSLAARKHGEPDRH